MSITSSFANALSGLGATGRQAGVASNNLANALTKGYARQSVDVSSSVLGGFGSGVRVAGVNRAAAPDLTAARRDSDADAATIDPQASALDRLGRSLGEATANDGLFRRLESFETALRMFAETPEAEARQLQTVDAARDLVGMLNGLSTEASTVRQNADANIAAQVATVNRNVEQIDSLNAKITRLSAGGRDVANLIDERERLIDEVNAILPVRTHARDNNTVHLTTAQGVFLLAEEPVPLTFTANPIITAPMTFIPGGGGALSGLTLGTLDITPGGSHPQRVTKGALAGNFAVRDEIGVDFNSRIDQFAVDLIQRFEDPAVDPTLAPGDPGLFTDNGGALDLTTIEGLAGDIEVNALADPAQGGDPSLLRDGLQALAPGPNGSDTIPRAMLDALTAGRSAAAIPGVSGNLSSAQMIAGIAEAQGVLRTDAETELAGLTSTRLALANTEAETIGVNTDKELQDLILIEQAFSANLQVIQTASRMLQDLSEIR